MSNDMGGADRPDNIDTIRQLLRQLEEVAARDEAGAGFRPDSATVPSKTPAEAVPVATSPGARSRGLTMPLVSFVLGIVVAGGLIVALEPLRNSLREKPQAVDGRPATTATTAQSAPTRGEAPAAVEPARSPETGTGVATVAATDKPQDKAETVGAPIEPREPAAAPVAAEQPRLVPVPPRTHQIVVAPLPVETAPSPGPLNTAPVPTTAVVATDLPARGAGEPSGTTSRPSTQLALQAPDRLVLRPGERRGLDLAIAPPAGDAARLLVVLRGVPEWLSLSHGGAVGDGIWLLPAHVAGDLAIEVADAAKGSADVAVQLTSSDGRIVAESRMGLRVQATPTPPSIMAEVPLIDPQMLSRLQARGELLIDTGEVEAARTLLRTAAEAGSVSAALRLAETYDPREVQRLGVMDGAADSTMAVRWYRHAEALGSPVASARLATFERR